MNNLVKLLLIDTVAKPLIGAVVSRVSSKVAGKQPDPVAPPMTLNGLEELRKLQEDYAKQKRSNKLAHDLIDRTLELARERNRPPNDTEHVYHLRQLQLTLGVLQGDRGMIYQASEELYPK